MAGVAALLQGTAPTLTHWPEGCRAILAAGASRNIRGDTWWRDVLAGVDARDGERCRRRRRVALDRAQPSLAKRGRYPPRVGCRSAHFRRLRQRSTLKVQLPDSSATLLVGPSQRQSRIGLDVEGHDRSSDYFISRIWPSTSISRCSTHQATRSDTAGRGTTATKSPSSSGIRARPTQFEFGNGREPIRPGRHRLDCHRRTADPSTAGTRRGDVEPLVIG